MAVVFFAHDRSFTDDDLTLAGHLADAAKGALERGRLFERERSARRLSQHLARIGTFLATELDPSRVVEEVAAEAPELLGADAGAIRLVEGDELVLRAASAEVGEEHAGTRSPVAAGLAGEVVQFRAPLRVADVDDRTAVDPDPLLAGHRSYLGVPLTGAEGGLLGVLSVYARGVRDWRDDEVEALVALAGNASTALSTAELYQRVAVEKERSETILAHVADGIVAVDRDGKVVLWNEAATRITGIDRGDVLGRDPAEVLKRSLADPASEDGGTRILAIPRGGEEVWLSLSEAVMRDPSGEIAGRIFTFRDVSAQRLVEQMKSGFVSTVSHQLRAPLTSIYGFAETLLRHDINFSDEERRTFLQYVASESERLTAIVDMLLNVARLEAGDLHVELAPTDLRALVADVVEHADPAVMNGHEFVLELPEQPLEAQADDEKLRQVLVNLVDNAVKYSPAGGRVVISATAEQRPRDGRSRRHRRGDGHPPGRARPDLLEVLQPRRSGQPGGHGGRSRAVHRRGSRFCDGRTNSRVLDRGRRIEVRLRASARRARGGGDVTRVLVVDDDAPIRLLCRVNLEAEGMEVMEAADGADGLEQARSAQPDVVLLDVMLPKLDGWRVAEALLEDPDDRRDPDRLPDGARRAARPGARPRARRHRLHHEAVQPGRARRPDPRAARPRPARRARRACARRSSPASAAWRTASRPSSRRSARAVCASTIPPSTIAPPTICIGSSASSSQTQATTLATHRLEHRDDARARGGDVVERADEERERDDRAEDDDPEHQRPDREVELGQMAEQRDVLRDVVGRERPPRLDDGEEERAEQEAVRRQRDRVARLRTPCSAMRM